MTKLKLPYFGHIMRKLDSLEKAIMLGGNRNKRKRGRPCVKWINSMKEFMGMSLQVLKGAVEDRTVCISLLHRVVRTQSKLNGM